MIRHRKFLVLLAAAVLIKLFSLSAPLVERFYSSAFYPLLARSLRWLLGPIPISLGDLLYFPLGIFLIYFFFKLLMLVRSGALRQEWRQVLISTAAFLLILYISFSLLWGLNYYRKSIATQVQIQPKQYSRENLESIFLLLKNRLNDYAALTDSVKREQYQKRSVLVDSAYHAYSRTSAIFPFLLYQQPSVKVSMYSFASHYIGFTGYFNPFTSEAQINTEVPVFLQPFIIAHEIGHQLGYAKENEASFAAFLACMYSGNPDFRYSILFELYRTVAVELSRAERQDIDNYFEGMHPRVLADKRDLEMYLKKYKNPVEPFITAIYDRYLKLNNQPEGKATYNYVLSLVFGYVDKFGAQSL